MLNDEWSSIVIIFWAFKLRLLKQIERVKTNWTILTGKLFNINLQSFRRKKMFAMKIRRNYDVIDLLIVFISFSFFFFQTNLYIEIK